MTGDFVLRKMVLPYICGFSFIMCLPKQQYEKLAFRVYDAQAQYMIGGDVFAALFQKTQSDTNKPS